MQPTLSIVIPTHNRIEQLRFLVGRFRKMMSELDAINKVELVVVDDGSTERFYNETFDEVILLRNATCLGAPASREIGFQHSTGNYVHFHDSDDDISDNWLEGILNSIATTQFDYLFTPRVARTADDVIGKLEEPKALQSLLSLPLSLKNYLSYENCVGPLGAVTFSRRTVAKMSFPSLASCQDWHMYWEALQKDSVLIYEPRIWLVYNRTGLNRISSSADRKRAGFNGVTKLMCKGQRKRILVNFYLNLDFDVKRQLNSAPLKRLIHAVLRPIILELARTPTLDKLLFGRSSS
jgi:glycosyltransferase involved in cell wall biosynthesis